MRPAKGVLCPCCQSAVSGPDSHAAAVHCTPAHAAQPEHGTQLLLKSAAGRHPSEGVSKNMPQAATSWNASAATRWR